MTDAILLTDGSMPAVRLERLLLDPPAVVWKALTDREELRSWFPCDVIVSGGEWKVGAGIEFPFSADLTWTGEVLELDEPNVLAFTWAESTLRFELSAVNGGTRLVLTDRLPPNSAARNAAGWEQCLDRLAGIAGRYEWQPRFESYTASFEPLVGAQEGPPGSLKG